MTIPLHNTRQVLTRFPPGVANMRVLPGVGHHAMSRSASYISSLQRAR